MPEPTGVVSDGIDQSTRRLLDDECFTVEDGNNLPQNGHLLAVFSNRLFQIKPIYSLIYRAGIHLLPSFLRPQPLTQKNQTTPPPSSIHQSTAYLSGLRGVASAVVFIYHFAHGSYPGIDHAYGDHNNNNSVLQLPVIRLFYAAEAMVALFFLISGYLLSHRCVRHIHARNAEEAYAAISSLAFRRAARLYLPAFGSSSLAYLAQRAGWMPAKGLPQDYVPDFASDTRQYLHYLGRALSVWTWDVKLDGWWYNPHLWTIPVEFRCSMVLFLLISTTARCRTSIRLLLDITLIAHCLLAWRWDVALFIMGKILAEFSAMREEQNELNHNEVEGEGATLNDQRIQVRPQGCQLRNRTSYLLLALSFLLGLYLASYPASPPQHAPIYSLLSALMHHDKAGRRIYYALAAILVLCPLTFLPVLQRPLNSTIPRYLGKISYSLYLVHGTLIRVVGGRILRWAWGVTGTDGWWQFNIGFGFATVLFIPVVIWVADLFEQVVEKRCVDFAAWMELKATSGMWDKR